MRIEDSSALPVRFMLHDLEVDDLYYDLRAPLDVARSADDDPRRHFIMNHVEKALDLVDLRPGDLARFHASVAAARVAAQTHL